MSVMSDANVMTHLLDRLAEAGVEKLFGVPGDFTLAMLDDVEAHPSIEWVGCANELGAGYAADGYARLRGLGAVCTTFGVGELSAINAIAGAYAEHVPVIHIVGAPTTATQAAARATHHTLGDGDFHHFARMTAEVTHAQAELTAENAVDEIDRVIRETLAARRPGYLVIPADVAKAPVPESTHPPVEEAPLTAAGALEQLRDAVRVELATARSVALLAGILVQRMGAEPALHDVLALGIPHAVTLWGRRVVDESSPHYLGPYIGAVSTPETCAAIEDADVLIAVGVQFTDLMSGFFSQRLPARTIEITPGSVHLGLRTFEPIEMSDALEVLREALAESAVVGRSAPDGGTPDAAVVADAEAVGTTDSPLDQTGLWNAVAAHLQAGDVVIADQGTSFYGMGTHRMPTGVTFMGQPLWAAIGYTLPALLGAALAAPERRPIVLIGDGAAQLTIAELGTLIRNRVPAIVLVVNNAGYTVERAIHGLTEAYNDIAAWNWTALISAFDPHGFAHPFAARTADEVSAAFAGHADRGGLTFIEAIVPPLDVPPLLAALAEQASRANSSSHD